MLDYSRWARDRLLDGLRVLSEDQLRQAPGGGVYGSIHDTLAHLAVSEWMWVQRCRGESPMRLPRGEDFPQLHALLDWWNDVHAQTMVYVTSLVDSDLEKTVTYVGPDGVARTRKVWHMLMQVANHQTEHRTQVAGMLGMLGQDVPPTDLVVYLSQRAQALESKPAGEGHKQHT